MAKRGMQKGRYHCTKQVRRRIRGHFRKVCLKFSRKRGK